MFKARQNRDKVFALKNAFFLGLLAIYVIGTAPITLLHHFHHYDAVVLHDQEQEKDLCHRSIYHSDFKSGCDHGLHIAIEESCDQCDFSAPLDQIHIALPVQQPLSRLPAGISTHFFPLVTYAEALNASRAPPALV